MGCSTTAIAGISIRDTGEFGTGARCKIAVPPGALRAGDPAELC